MFNPLSCGFFYKAFTWYSSPVATVTPAFQNEFSSQRITVPSSFDSTLLPENMIFSFKAASWLTGLASPVTGLKF
jgi:hypothetical protein